MADIDDSSSHTRSRKAHLEPDGQTSTRHTPTVSIGEDLLLLLSMTPILHMLLLTHKKKIVFNTILYLTK